MARIFAWCDHPHAPTGFGRSAKHVLYAFHEAGHQITQLAVNADAKLAEPPWKVVLPSKRDGDPYGMGDLLTALQSERVDAFWTTFDPEVPWRYRVPDTPGDALTLLSQVRRGEQGGMAMLGWFPVDGGPLSDFEMAVLSNPTGFDVAATMSPHVHDLIEWTVRLRGQQPDMDAVRDRVQVIPHGVELDRYAIPTHAERAEAKRAMGIDPDRFVILQLERNQQRKQNYLAMEVMETLLAKRPKLRGRALLYQHMLQNEETQASTLGFNLPELAWRYGLEPGRDIMWPGGFVPEEVLYQTVYRAADCFLSVSTGEGFQYPAWEALACGIPLVVPDTDARRAWFSRAPNVHLYGADERRLVMRGGYNRRMNIPRPPEAARAILRLIDRPAKGRAREAGRAFVADVADHRKVAERWTEILEEQLDVVRQARMSNGIVDGHVLDDTGRVDAVVDCSPALGLGDTILAAPALELLRRKHPRLAWRLPKQNHWLARAMDVADIATEDVPAAEKLPLHKLYHPTPEPRWIDPRQNRTELIASELGLHPGELERFEAELPAEGRHAFVAQFLGHYGVDPTACIGICVESASPHRALPAGVASQLAERILGMGATPALIGQRQLPVARVGVINMTGTTGPAELQYLCGTLGAMISTDTAPLYLAAVYGTPVVGIYTCVDPEARLRWVGRGTKATVTPPPDVEIERERFPAGPFPKAKPGAWAAHISVADIVTALRAATGMEEAELEVEG